MAVFLLDELELELPLFAMPALGQQLVWGWHWGQCS